MTTVDANPLRAWLDSDGGVDAWGRYLHDDVVVHMGTESVRGLRAVQDAGRPFATAFPDMRNEVHEVLAEGGLLAARIVVVGTHRGEFMEIAPTGTVVRFEMAFFGRMRDGKLAEVWEVADLAGLLQQLSGNPGEPS